MTSTSQYNPHDAGLSPADQNTAHADITKQLAEEKKARTSGRLTFGGFFVLNALASYISSGIAGVLFCAVCLGVPGYFALYKRGEFSAWVLFAIAVANLIWSGVAWAQRVSNFGSTIFFISLLFAFGFLQVAFTNQELRKVKAP